MSVKTNNIYGKIVISDGTIERFIAHVSNDCYGIVSFTNDSLLSAIMGFLKIGSTTKGIKVKTNGDRINIEVAVVVKYGISIKAVVDALKESIKYRVEKFTGMIVDYINVKIIDIVR